MRPDADLLRCDPNQIIGLPDAELRRLAVLRNVLRASQLPRKDLVAALLSSQAPPQRPPATTTAASGKKRAVLIGINYRGQRSELGGCITDTRYMHYCLTRRFGFRKDDILMLNEEQRNPYQIPTKANIYRAMQWLVASAAPGDSLVFMYSGHGDQVRDYSGEETDGLCETILPLDHQRSGPILDKELYQYLIRPLTSGVRLFALCDSCHRSVPPSSSPNAHLNLTSLSLPSPLPSPPLHHQWNDLGPSLRVRAGAKPNHLEPKPLEARAARLQGHRRRGSRLHLRVPG